MDPMFFENKKQTWFRKKTVERLSEIAPGNGWKIIQVLDLQG